MRIIAGTARSRVIKAPEGLDTRPTLDRVRENMFNVLQNRVRGARVLDLFAGSGAMALEAVSRGAVSAVLVDHDRAAAACIRENIEKLRFDSQCRLIQGDWSQAVASLRRAGAQFDLFFLDPPYKMLDLTAVTAALLPLMAPSALIVIEHKADTMPAVCDGLYLSDTRRWGIAGMAMYRSAEEGNA